MSVITDLAGVENALLSVQNKVDGFIEKAQGEIKTAGSLSVETKNALDKLTTQYGETADKLAALEKKVFSRDALTAGNSEESLGDRFIKSDAWAAMAKARAGRARFECKSIINSYGSTAQPLVAGDRVAVGIIPGATRRLTIRDMLSAGRTESNLVEFTRENVFTNNAGVQGGGTSPYVGDGATKGESTITYTLQTATAVTIAHFLRASKQVLADSPMLASYINTRLTYGLKLKEEAELLSGSGLAGHINGLTTQATAYNAAVTGDTPIDALRRAINQVDAADYAASAIVLNPADWSAIELTKDEQGRYVLGNPAAAAGTQAYVWRLPVVITNSMTSGHFLVGSFDQGAGLWDREDAAVVVSTEDSDNIQKNMVTMLSEERVAMTVYRPASFVYGAF